MQYPFLVNRGADGTFEMQIKLSASTDLKKINKMLDLFYSAQYLPLLTNIYWDECQSKTDTAPKWSQELFTVKFNWALFNLTDSLPNSQVQKLYSSDG